MTDTLKDRGLAFPEKGLQIEIKLNGEPIFGLYENNMCLGPGLGAEIDAARFALAQSMIILCHCPPLAEQADPPRPEPTLKVVK